MSRTPPGGEGPELRIGDSEREAAVSALGEHYAAGRLTKEEFDERADVAWAARTRSALWPLFTDLPHPAAARPAGSTAPPPVSSWPSGARVTGPSRPGFRPGPHTGSAPGGPWRPGWRIGGRMFPLLVVVVVLMVLTHLPVFLLLLVWLFFAKTHGAWGPGRDRRTHRRS